MGCVPVTILAGCARSGKTSFLAQLQQQGLRGRTAIVGKELSGCPHDLARLLRQMMAERERGAASFERIIVECDAQVSPARPALGLFVDEAVAGYYRLDAIVTIVDALHGLNQLAGQDVALKQAVFANRLLLSKADLVTPAQLQALRLRLEEVNPRAPVQTLYRPADLEHVFETGAFDLGIMLALEPQFFYQPEAEVRAERAGRADALVSHANAQGAAAYPKQ